VVSIVGIKNISSIDAYRVILRNTTARAILERHWAEIRIELRQIGVITNVECTLTVPLVALENLTALNANLAYS
jgi:hypothetical protein